METTGIPETQAPQTPQTPDERYAELYEDQVVNALLSGGAVMIQTEVQVTPKRKVALRLNMRWPTVGDLQEIGRMTTLFLGGFEPRLVPSRDLVLARARATIEVLGTGPFPDWLPPHDRPTEMPDGRTAFRPNTGAVTMPAALYAVFNEFDEVHERFQFMGK